MALHPEIYSITNSLRQTTIQQAMDILVALISSNQHSWTGSCMVELQEINPIPSKELIGTLKSPWLRYLHEIHPLEPRRTMIAFTNRDDHRYILAK